MEKSEMFWSLIALLVVAGLIGCPSTPIDHDVRVLSTSDMREAQ